MWGNPIAGKARRGISKYQTSAFKDLKKQKLVCLELLRQLKACSVSVAVSGVSFGVRNLFVVLKRGPERPTDTKKQVLKYVHAFVVVNKYVIVVNYKTMYKPSTNTN